MYACICACVYVCICVYVCLCISMHIHLYTLACGCTYALVYAHFVYLYCPISLLHARVSQAFLHTCMRVREGIGSRFLISLFIVSACYWRGRLCFGGVRDRGFVSYISLLFYSIKPILGNRHGPGVSSKADQGAHTQKMAKDRQRTNLPCPPFENLEWRDFVTKGLLRDYFT